MLNLLSSPAWVTDAAKPCPLPLTVPGALLAVLATHNDWLTRADLALIFWPDAAPADALHRLRINLHRARALLAEWGQEHALESDRLRLRLTLPTDLAALRAAQPRANSAPLSMSGPSQWLAAWRLPSFEGFRQWCDDTALALQTEWLAAGRDALQQQALHNSVAELPVSSSAAPHPFAAPTLPGRHIEMRRLLSSPHAALLLRGEPGAGKTTLLLAAYPHAPCLRGLEGLHAMPYRPLLHTLRQQLAVIARAVREPSHPLRPYRLDLARVLPELAPDEPLPPLDALTAQTRLVEALARAFEALTPVLLVDDLQWCDAATVEWLAMLAHSGRLRWRATVRPHELTNGAAQTLRALVVAARLEELDVLPLDRAALEEVCTSRWPDVNFSAVRLDRLFEMSGGNAFVLGELVDVAVNAPSSDADQDGIDSLKALDRVRPLVQRRLDALPQRAQWAVASAAVFAQQVPADALRVHELGTVAQPAQASESEWLHAIDNAVAAGLLRREAGGLVCRHDLIRHAVVDALPDAQRAALHRHAALWLAALSDVDALTVAEHWQAADEPQTALAWRHRGAEQLKARGNFSEARALWREVIDASTDVALRLRAQLDLAACDLFDNLAHGKAALNAVCAQLHAVAELDQRRHIEASALAAMVENRVFAGDVASAAGHAQRLRALMPELAPKEAVNATEILIELAMREPDIPAAWALLGQLRRLEPQRPTLLSYEGQIHWFGGQVQAAHDALARMLERHPDYCGGITIENDLAVMLQALGRIDEAETMAQRSLQSWAGVAHTETLSLLVLGLIQTSAGRYAQADVALQRALNLAREQASPGFESEALVRQARLLWQCGQFGAAQQALAQAAPLLADSPEPMRVSQMVWMQVLCASASGVAWPEGAVARLQALAQRSEHPLVHVRWERVAFEMAAANADWAAAAQAASHMAEHARRAGLLEPLAEALLLQAGAGSRAAKLDSGAAVMSSQLETTCVAQARQAVDLATRQGFADVRWRAASWLHANADGVTALNANAQAAEALRCLQGSARPKLFDAAAAARREPQWLLD
jgi:tetratricopeptide (TPR) repeat protein